MQAGSIRRWVAAVFQVLLGLALVGAIWLLLSRTFAAAEAQRLPAGWRIIRPPTDVCCLASSGDAVWSGGKDGLMLIDRLSGRVRPLPAGAPRLGYVRALLFDKQGTLWVAHDGGLAAYGSEGWRDLSAWLSPARRALSLLQDRQGRLWIGCEGQLVLRDAEGCQSLPIPREYRLPAADVLFEDSSGVVWVGCASATYGGLCSYKSGQWQEYPARTLLPHPSVNMIIESQEHTLWIATGFADSGGAARLRAGQWDSLTKRDGLAGNKVRSVYEDGQGRLWFGSEYAGVAILNGKGWRTIPPGAGLAGSEVKCILQDRDGAFWLGTNNGLSYIPQL